MPAKYTYSDGKRILGDASLPRAGEVRGVHGVPGVSEVSGLSGLSGLSELTGLRGPSGLSELTGLSGLSGLSGVMQEAGIASVPVTCSTSRVRPLHSERGRHPTLPAAWRISFVHPRTYAFSFSVITMTPSLPGIWEPRRSTQFVDTSTGPA
jgi:hypothetical protein